jgi:predicted Rossmann-fold nucleotide-binding protein
VDHSVEEGFIPPSHRDLIVMDVTPNGLLDKLETYKLPDLGRKWAAKKDI